MGGVAFNSDQPHHKLYVKDLQIAPSLFDVMAHVMYCMEQQQITKLTSLVYYTTQPNICCPLRIELQVSKALPDHDPPKYDIGISSLQAFHALIKYLGEWLSLDLREYDTFLHIIYKMFGNLEVPPFPKV